MIKKEAEIFGLLFLGDGATFLRCPLLNILASGENIVVAVLEIVDSQGHIAYGIDFWIIERKRPHYPKLTVMCGV